MNPAPAEWNQKGQLAGLTFMRTLWACEATGGPFRYTGKPLGQAHEHLRITPKEFDAVGTEIASALDHFGVPEPEKNEFLAAIVAHKAEVTNP